MNRVSSTIAAMLMVLAVPQITRSVVVPHVESFLTQEHAPNQEQLQIFTGTIISITGGMFALREDANAMLYGLDNQALARQFANKKVAVTGTLDKTATIHVKSIEEQKA